jgi:hypothetical protein
MRGPKRGRSPDNGKRLSGGPGSACEPSYSQGLHRYLSGAHASRVMSCCTRAQSGQLFGPLRPRLQTDFRSSKEIDPDVAGLQHDGVLALPFLLQFPRRVSKDLNSWRTVGEQGDASGEPLRKSFRDDHDIDVAPLVEIAARDRTDDGGCAYRHRSHLGPNVGAPLRSLVSLGAPSFDGSTHHECSRPCLRPRPRLEHPRHA